MYNVGGINFDAYKSYTVLAGGAWAGPYFGPSSTTFFDQYGNVFPQTIYEIWQGPHG